MLLLGVAGVSRSDIVRDYLYSFVPVRQVDHFVETGEAPQALAGGRLEGRLQTIGRVYDAVVEAHGSIEAYVRACGLSSDELGLLRCRLIG